MITRTIDLSILNTIQNDVVLTSITYRFLAWNRKKKFDEEELQLKINKVSSEMEVIEFSKFDIIGNKENHYNPRMRSITWFCFDIIQTVSLLCLTNFALD